MIVGRALSKLLVAMAATEVQPEGPNLPNLLLPIVDFRSGSGWTAQNNQQELTNQPAATVLGTLTLADDGFYDVWGVVSAKTALAATVRVFFVIQDESANIILVLADRYIGTTVASFVEIPPPGVALWLRKNWLFAASQQTATGVGETLRGDVTLLRRFQT